MLLTPAQIKPKTFESKGNFFFFLLLFLTRGGWASCLRACLGARLTLTILLYVHRSEVAYWGRGGEEGVRVKARPRIPPEKDRRNRGPPPENGSVKALSPRHCAAVTTAMLGRVTRTMSVALLLRNNPKLKKSNFRRRRP